MAPGLVVPAPHAPLSERRWMAVVLVVGLLHGLIYVFLVPPWQHYDEPSHFEFAWLILEQRGLPKIGAYDNGIRRELAQSMMAHGFFRNLGFVPNLEAQGEPIWIGVSKTGIAPLYYIAMDVPLALFSWADVTVRLYAVRLTSLAMFGLVLWFAYRLVSELTPPGHPLRWSVPASLALLPALTDIMTAFNDDAGAIFIFSLFLWAVVRLMLRGASARRVLAVLVLAVVCGLTKNTALIAVPLALVAVPIALVPRRWLGAAIAALALLAAVALVSIVGWGDAADWYSVYPQKVPTRAALAAPWGHSALRLISSPGEGSVQVRQFVLDADASALYGKQVTVGAWIWASTPGPAMLPLLNSGGSPMTTANVGTTPAFYSLTTTLGPKAARLAIDIVAPPNPADTVGRTIYYDGLMLVEGTWPAGSLPVLSGADGQSGTWDGRVFVNHLRNASFEQGAPWVRSWAETLFGRTAAYYFSLSRLVGSLYDTAVTAPILRQTSQVLLETFWARFSWAQIVIPPVGYTVLGWVTLLGAGAGTVRTFQISRRQSLAWKRAVAWLALATVSTWVTVLLKGLFTITDDHIIIPVARYAYPVVIPSMLLLVLGWQACLGWLRGWRVALPLILFLVLDVVSLVTIYRYYQ